MKKPAPAISWRLLVTTLILLSLIIATGFQVEPLDRVQHYARQDVAIIAHAGAQGHAPANTLPAFERAMAQGANTLEMDLQLTSDAAVVVLHDATVERTTNGKGAVRDLSLEQIKALDAGWTFENENGGHPYRGQGLQILTLTEVFESFPDAHLILELKTDAGPAIVQPVIDLIKAHDREQNVTVASFNADYLIPVRRQLPDTPTNMPEGESTAFYLRHLIGLHPWWQAPGQVIQIPQTHDIDLGVVELTDVYLPTTRLIRAAERLGLEVHVWTVNEPKAFNRLLDAGVHGIITDYPDRLAAVVAERKSGRMAVTGPDVLANYQGQIERSQWLQDELSWLTPLMRVAAALGDKEFYLLVFPLLYWCISRSLGLRLGVMLLLTAGINSALKLLFVTPRPIFLVPEVGRVVEGTFGLPSGHAQTAVAVWGSLAVILKRWWALVAAVILTALIGWSRIHLGVHFLEDILSGWLVGGVLVLGYVWFAPRVERWWQNQRPAQQLLAVFTASLAIIAPAALLAARLQGWDPGFPGLIDPHDALTLSYSVTTAGTLMGLGIGLVFLKARGDFNSAGPWLHQAGRILIGLVGVVAIWQGLGSIFPRGDEPLALVLRYLRYALVGAWIIGLAPVLFVRLGLARPGQSS